MDVLRTLSLRDVRPTIRQAMRAVARRWWLAAGVIALVAGGAAFADFGPGAAHTYLASESGADQSSYAAYLVREDELAAARATDGFVASPQFAAAVAARASAASGAHFTASDVAGALSATHMGNVVTLSARWSTQSGTSALLAAAAAELSAETAAGQIPTQNGLTSAFRLRVEAPTTVAGALPDPATQAAARRDFLLRVAAGVSAGLLLAALVAWLEEMPAREEAAKGEGQRGA
jgi:hypothetical protein